MTPPIEGFEQYLQGTLHVPVTLEPWRGEAELPNYLRSRYRFFDSALGDMHILLLQTNDELTPTTAKKHAHALREQWAGPIAFVLNGITARSRGRLVREGVAFVVPRKQVYLPMLGINLSERFTRRTVETDRLRPSAQLLLLHVLTQRDDAANTPSAAARQLGYTAMAMGQALDQLEAAGLVRTRKAGRERVFELAGSAPETWERAQAVLGSPVKRRSFAAKAQSYADTGLVAGLSALAAYSDLAEPRVPTVAVLRTPTSDLARGRDSDDLVLADEAEIQVEFWSYAPKLLASCGRTVDRLSLFLSLREDPDERVQTALEQMMRGMTW